MASKFEELRSRLKLSTIVAVVLCGAAVVAGGSSTRSSFPLVYDGVADSNMTATASGIGLAVEKRIFIKLSGDALPGTLIRGSYPDVAAVGVDSFSVWYVDTSTDRIVTQGIKSSIDGSVATGAVVQAGSITAPRDCYLHADRGANGSCLAYVHAGTGNKRYLRVSNGTAVRTIDSASSGWLFPSQAAMTGDTFLVVAGIDMNRTTLRKIYSRDALLNVVGTATVATGSATVGNSLMSCGVAADPAGTICAIAVRGVPSGDKYVEYQFYGRDLTPGPAGNLSDPIAPDTFFYYDDAVIVAYGIGRFAIVTWDGAGVMLHDLAQSGNTIQKTSQRIIDVPGARFCTATTNGRYLVIACVGDADKNGIAGIEGVKYPVVNNILGTPEILTYSNSSVAVQTADEFSTAINSAIDDSGTVVITWRHQMKIALCVWAHRSIRFRRAFYTSPVESLATFADSVQFSPAQVTLSSAASWYTEDSLRFGAVPAACAAAPWLSFSNSAVLRANRTRARYYQYRIAINRTGSGSVDSISTPVLSEVTIPWNMQPRIEAIDSVVAGTSVDRSVTFGDTIDLVARRDSVRCHLRGHDDDGGTVTIDLSLVTTPDAPQLAGGPDYRTTMAVHPLADANDVVPCSLTIVDAAGWRGQPRVVQLRTRNLLPQLSCALVTYDRQASGDTVKVNADTVVVIQEEDSMAVIYSVADGNDSATVRGYLRRLSGGDTVVLDSALPGVPSIFRVHGDTVQPVDTVRLLSAVRDIDTTFTKSIRLLVNHRPQLLKVIYGKDTLFANDTANVTLDDTARFTIVAHDTDCTFGDTLLFRSRLLMQPDSMRVAGQSGTLGIVPVLGDSQVLLSVTDRFGRIDSFMVQLAYPWYETDSLKNPGYSDGRRALAGGSSLIGGSERGDTIMVPVLNTGHDPLHLTGTDFAMSSSSWLRLMVDGSDTSFTVTAADDHFSRPVVVAPGATVTLAFIITADSLAGDGVVADTVRIFTDDPKHRSDMFVVSLEYNDLPRIVAVSPDFVADRPYRLMSKRTAYRFPPHASIAITFSEPIDSASARSGLRLYSIPDMRVRGSYEPIPLKYDWAQNFTVLRVSPHYKTVSPAFKLLPPEGLFIPTDSLLLVLSDSLVDRARTPHGPNALDINRNNERGPDSDTLMGMRVDSIGFTVGSIDPLPDKSGIDRRVRIGITFSSPVYAASVDTSREHNRSFQVTSAYNNGQSLRFSSVKVENARVEFTVEQECFYRDTLRCRYRSRWIGDRLGYAADNNGDGIDATMFDTAALVDDLSWGYRIRTVGVATVDPDSEATVSAISPAVTIRFDGALPPGVIDTDTSRGNRSFVMGSGRTGPTSFVTVSRDADGMGVTFHPRTVFFSDDSIYCKFTGFRSTFRYDTAVNLPDSPVESFGGYEWSFKSANVGFYTYPNPFKPRLDPRQCAGGGPCGIWFKNLHALAVNLQEVDIAVFSMNAHPVFDTRTTGERIIFSPASGVLPQWCWNTKNNRGDPVASGIYLYAIYNPAGTMLKKGKLIIAR